MADLEACKSAAKAVIDRESAALREVSLSIHSKPELNYEEHHAHAVLTDYLETKGFHVKRRAYGMQTAFEAVAGSGQPRVAILCEYDALPGIGHACGHNLIAISGLATGLALKETLGEGHGTVVVLGSPAEEGGGGKIRLIEGGAFDGVDAAMMLHPTPHDAAYMNVLAIDNIELEYHGKNAHAAAAPWEGVNALDAMILAFNAISAMRQQILPTDRVHGVITNGGVKPNIIPDYTSASFYVRSKNHSDLEKLRKKIVGCMEGVAVSTGCTVTIKTPEGYRPYSDMIASDALADAYTENAGSFGLRLPSKQQVLSGTGGSTDMGNVSYVVPSIHPVFGIPAKDGNHTPGFTDAAATPQAHEATIRAAKALAMTALDVFFQPDLLKAARAEFAAHVRGR